MRRYFAHTYIILTVTIYFQNYIQIQRREQRSRRCCAVVHYHVLYCTVMHYHVLYCVRCRLSLPEDSLERQQEQQQLQHLYLPSLFLSLLVFSFGSRVSLSE